MKQQKSKIVNQSVGSLREALEEEQRDPYGLNGPDGEQLAELNTKQRKSVEFWTEENLNEYEKFYERLTQEFL